MTPAQLAAMSPVWIARSVQIELVATTLERFPGPRFAELIRDEQGLLRWSCEPWYFPRPLTIYHLDWVNRRDFQIFHRTRLDPSAPGRAGEPLVLSGMLRVDPNRGTIENE